MIQSVDMPIIKSAIKKLRKDKKRTVINRQKENVLKDALKKARKTPNVKNVQEAESIIDKAAKSNLIHKNKAARLKSKLAKLAVKKSIKAPKKTKTTSKKSKKT